MTPKFCNDCIYKSKGTKHYETTGICILYGKFKKNCKEKIKGSVKMPEKVIHYKILFDILSKQNSSDTKLLAIYSKLHEWRENDKRKRLNANTI